MSLARLEVYSEQIATAMDKKCLKVWLITGLNNSIVMH